MKIIKSMLVATMCLLMLTNCMESKGETSGTSTKDGAYNEDTRSPEYSGRKGEMEQTHKPNTGPDNDSDSMQ